MADNFTNRPVSYEPEYIKTLFKLQSLAAKLLNASGVLIKLDLHDDVFCYPPELQAQARDILKAEQSGSAQGYPFCFSVDVKTSEGEYAGAFYVLDTQDRILTDEEKEGLNDIVYILSHQIELELKSKKTRDKHQQVLNTTAHDLKNPLTTIPVRADLIKLKKHDPEMVEKMCDQIKIASLNMISIIDELLQSGYAEDGKIQLLLVKLDVSTLVNNVVAMNQPLAERKHQTIHVKNEVEAVVLADEGKLSEVIDNLVNNAIKYSPLNTSIHIEVDVVNDKALIVVQDEGQGLTADDKLKLYQPFTQLSAQPTGGENSTGLGLSIVKVLVEAHKGKIYVESEGRGTGTRFAIELPLCR